MQGRAIDSIYPDNLWKPVRTVAATKRVIEKEGAFSLIGSQASAVIHGAEQFLANVCLLLFASIVWG